MVARRVRSRSSVSLASLPEDIMMGIFSTLPMKDLVRSSRVCKSWRNLITSPESFKLFHCQNSVISGQNSDDPVEFLLLDDCKDGEKPEVQIRERLWKLIEKLAGEDGPVRTHRLICKDGEISLVGCCNGMLCFVKQGEISCDIYLCNPVLGQVSYLSMSEFDLCSRKNGVVTFFYDDHDSDYKVVKIIECCNFLKVMVYSLKSNSWKTFSPLIIPSNRAFLLKVSNDRAQFIVHKGRIYVLVYLLVHDVSVEAIHGPYFIIILDVNKEQARTIPVPNLTACPIKLFLTNGSVAISSWFFSRVFRVSELWELREDANYNDNPYWMFKKDEWEIFWNKREVSYEDCPPVPLLPYRTTGATMGTDEDYFLSSDKGSEFLYNIPSRDLWVHVIADYVPSFVSVKKPVGSCRS